ncbi:hypothetical protein DXN04_32990 [Chitinophaga silvisoli]|uniref:Uncharacterized protein n=1 Tax=Chitinophaga silvisoli TaxID=2291814 RepID=A0A3E1NNH2_9BACT|nr:hypothetical protein DXN04_32990 [Chitinophaga silvisoli]
MLFLIQTHLEFPALIAFPGSTGVIVTTGGVNNRLYDNHSPKDSDYKRMGLYSPYDNNYTHKESYNAEKTPGFEYVFHGIKFEG